MGVNKTRLAELRNPDRYFIVLPAKVRSACRLRPRDSDIGYVPIPAEISPLYRKRLAYFSYLRMDGIDDGRFLPASGKNK